MGKKIISYNFIDFKDCVKKIDFDNLSLLDADILLLAPHVPRYLITTAYDTNVNKKIRNWVSWADQFEMELTKLLQTNVTIFVFMQKEEHLTFSIKLDQHIVSSYHILGTLDNTLTITNSFGTEILFQNNPILSNYWQKYSTLSFYDAYFDVNLSPLNRLSSQYNYIPCFSTKVPGNDVGGIININDAHIVLLPNLKWREVNPDEILNQIIMIDSKFRNQSERSVKPDWVTKVDFPLPHENELNSQIIDYLEEKELAERKIAYMEEEISALASYRDLLFETGKRLEESVIKALKLIGFSAEEYLDYESQFDVVFISPEGRFLGEVEGKDNSVINVNKISQLLRNLGEDGSKNIGDEPAKGVLFGNANRYTKPICRNEFFTAKCIKSAVLSNIALIKTPDLFWVTKFLLENPNAEEIKKICRQKMLQESGEVNIMEILPVNLNHQNNQGE